MTVTESSLYSHAPCSLTMLRAASKPSVRRDMSALRYLALMSRTELMRSAAQAHR